MAFVDGTVLTAAVLNLAFTQKGDVTYVDAGDAAARAFAIQRANHTGTQAANTITGLATVATSGSYPDLTGRPLLGTISTQNSTAVAITGGSINGTSIGATSALSGTFTNLVSTGIATLNSMNVVSAAINGGSINATSVGVTTRATGAFTALSSTGVATLASLTTAAATLTGGTINAMSIGATTRAAGSFTTVNSNGIATLNSMVTASVTITGGTVNGTTIGATTRAAGSFTTIAANSSILSSGAVGIGYATGAGASVTQLTDKSTAVTLNNPTGRITMNAATLGANGQVAFTVNNSLIAATDFPAVIIASGATPLTYAAFIGGVSAGSCVVVLRNFSGVSQSDAVVLNFMLFKGVIT